MSDRLLLDTHTWLWLEMGSPKISLQAQARIRRAANAETLYIAAISLHEIAYAAMRKRLELQIGLDEWLALALQEPAPRILPLTPAIAVRSASLPSEFHGDPSDRLIAATAMVHDLVLCTRDGLLIRFEKQGIYNYLEI